MHPEDAAAWPELIERAIAGVESFTVECRLRRRDGRYRWLHKTGRTVLWREG
jgi:PAS domain-containing protein